MTQPSNAARLEEIRRKADTAKSVGWSNVTVPTTDIAWLITLASRAVEQTCWACSHTIADGKGVICLRCGEGNQEACEECDD